MEYVKNYWHNPKQKKAFQQFMFEIFKLDFTDWDKNGFWDENYIPYSFFKNGKVVSNVNVYSLPCIINGEQKKVAQISAVGTLPEFRNKGLNKQLTDQAMEWIANDHEFVFLFSSEMAIDYYKKYGFLPTKEFVVRKKNKKHVKEARGGLKKFTPENINIVYDKVINRTSVSNIFSCLSDKLLMFHILYSFKNKLYYIEDLDLLIAMEQKDDRLIIYDIIGKEMPEYNVLESYINHIPVNEYEFRFHTEKLKLEGAELIELKGNNLFIWKESLINNISVFPFTLQA